MPSLECNRENRPIKTNMTIVIYVLDTPCQFEVQAGFCENKQCT